MRKAIPCKQCGIVQVPKEGDYIIGKLPRVLTLVGGVLTSKCTKCYKVSRLNRSEWNALPDLDKEIDDAKAKEVSS